MGCDRVEVELINGSIDVNLFPHLQQILNDDKGN